MAFKNDFRPDIIAGNPPYNNGMDIDFVFDAFEVTKVAVAEITPAKFQTAEADQKIASQHSYGDFRSELVPHICSIIFYMDAAEVFAIEQPDGVVAYTLTKRNIDQCLVINRCKHQKYFNNFRYRDITHQQSLNNAGNDLYEYLGNYNKYSFKENYGQYEVYTGGQVAWGHAWGYSERLDPCSLISRDGNCYAVGVSKIIDSNNDNIERIPTDAIKTFSSDSLEECESFISWINTKFTRFFALINIGKRCLVDNAGFRFVPEPPLMNSSSTVWNHLYTDTELYKYYNLDIDNAVTKDGYKFIDIIESVIKGRIQ